MNPLVSFEGPVGWVILALPLAALAITAITALLAAGRRRKTEIEFDSRENRASGFAASTDVESTGKPGSGSSGDERRIGPALPKSRAALETAIADAELGGDAKPLANLYLELGSLERATGDAEAAAVLLRKSIVLAKETGLTAVHAKGRLELGDLAQEAGDLGTACEHWQMARALFEGMELSSERAEAEARMHSNGCPTDWVLTDF